MRIVIATPLYPPDVDAVALYVKELARRFATMHEVTVLCSTRLPEQIENVRIITTDKRRALPFRLFASTRALARAARDADVLYTMNGASVELPMLLVSFISRTPIFFGIADADAHERTTHHPFTRLLERAIRARSRATITDFPLQRPEILPLEPEPTEVLAAYDDSWRTHMTRLSSLFTYA